MAKRLQDSANRAGSVFLLKPQLAFVGQQPMGPSIVLNEAVTGPAPGELTPEFRELELRLALSFGFAEEPSAPIAQGQRLESLYPDSNFRYAKELLAFERRQRGFGNAPMSSWSTARVRELRQQLRRAWELWSWTSVDSPGIRREYLTLAQQLTRHIEELGESAGLSSHLIGSLLDHASAKDATRLWKHLKSAMLRQTAAAPGIGKSTECVADASAADKGADGPRYIEANQRKAAGLVGLTKSSINRMLQYSDVDQLVSVEIGGVGVFNLHALHAIAKIWKDKRPGRKQRLDEEIGRLRAKRRGEQLP